MRVGSVTVKHLNLPGKTTKFLTEGSVDGKSCHILLDSGSSATLVSEDLVRRHKILSSTRQLISANGSRINAIGQAFVSIALSKQTAAVMKVDVVRGLAFDCILGVDGLSTLNVTLQFGKMKAPMEKDEELIINSISDVEIGADLSTERKRGLNKLLHQFVDLFDGTLGRTSVVKHRIRTGDRGPVKKRPYRLPLAKQKVVTEQVQSMLDKGIILPSSSPWCSPAYRLSEEKGWNRPFLH